MAFTDLFKIEANSTLTENGGKAFKSTGSDLLNLFATIGGKRDAKETEIEEDYLAARCEDKELADNLILWCRDIRNGGCGERRIGRVLLRSLAEIDPSKVIRNFQTIVDAGRWDDLYCFIETPVEDDMWAFIKAQFISDMTGYRNNKPISLMAKWLKSVNTSSKESKALGYKTAEKLNLSPKIYRKALSKLRKYLNVCEQKMSKNEWDEIDYSTVPSYAMSHYQTAFYKHDEDRYTAFLSDVKAGKQKINASVLYPYDFFIHWNNNEEWGRTLSEVDNLQWDNLPNYVEGNFDVLVMPDVSGSMYWAGDKVIGTSVGLATYFAQRNEGAYKGLVLNFAEKPTFCDINGKTTSEAFEMIASGNGYSTNLNLAFKVVWELAKETNEVPKALVVISDMEIDSWSDTQIGGIVNKWNKEFLLIGLQMPKLILWNVESRGKRFLATQNDNVAFVSGSGVGPFKNLCTLIEKDAYTAMKEILTQPAFGWR